MPVEDWTEYLDRWKRSVELVQRNTKPFKMSSDDHYYFAKFIHDNQNPRNARGDVIMDRGLRQFRFWFNSEVFHIQYGIILTGVDFFEDWCWEVLSQYRYFSPNTHFLIVYPDKQQVDIYLERGYGD